MMGSGGVEAVEELDRVLTRLALTPDDKLEQVLHKLLPLVIGRLNGASAAVQKKVLEILSHVNKRIKALPALQLPLHELVAAYRAPDSGPMARNFALVYIETAAGRAPPAARFAELDALLEGDSRRPGAHQEILLRIAAQALEAQAQQGNAFEYGQEEAFAARYPFLSSPQDRGLLLAHGAKLMLYQPPSVRAPSSALQAAQQAQQAQPMEVDGPPPPPPGMSRADVAAVEGKQPPPADALLRRKLGLLNFSAAAGMDPAEMLLVYLAAACDPDDQVSRRGEELLKKKCGVDSPKPAVDLEDGELVERLYVMFHGTAEDTSVPEQERRTPANVALKSRLLGLFAKSVAAANCFPYTLTTITWCLYGASTTPRLRQLGMELAVWVFRNSEPRQLAPAAAAILDGCLSLLDHDSSKGLDTVSLTLRGFTYQAIGQLAQRQPQAFAGRTDIAARFFNGLTTEPAGVRAAVQEAVSSLGGAFKGCQDEVLAGVRQLLLDSIQAPHESVRMAALQWALKLFPFSDVPARYVCILGAADTRHSIAEAAADGLKPDKFVAVAAAGAANGAAGGAARAGTTAAAAAGVEFPSFEGLMKYLVGRHLQLGRAVEEGAALPLPAKAFQASISFLERCREAQPLDDPAAAQYLTLLENALVRDAPSELHAAALEAILAVAGRHSAAFTGSFAGRTALLLRLLGHVDIGARWTASKLLGMLVPALEAAQAAQLVGGLLGTLSPEEGRKPRFEETDGALAALGFISAQLILAPPSGVSPDLLPSALAQLQRALQSPGQDSQLAASAALALGHASLAFGDGAAPAAVLPLAALPGAEEIVGSVAGLLQDKDVKVVRRAAQALGYLCRGHSSSAAVLAPACEALLGLRTSKSEEALFAAGEALCWAFGGVRATASDVLCTRYHSLGDWMKQQEGGQQEQPPGAAGPGAAADGALEPMDAEGAGAAAQQAQQREGAGAGVPAALAEAQDKILGSIMDEYVLNSRVEVRCAGAVWLVSLVLYTGAHPRIVRLLPDIQDTLSQLLGDSNELTQEMASRGLAAVYNLADGPTRQALVDALVGTLSGAPQKRRAVKVSGETQVFESGQLGAVPGGGSLSTYKELCALATDLGQPDLVYRFMELANHQAAVNSSRGAAFGFASIARMAGEQLQPHIARIIPRLYRYLYDPNGKVRDAMNHIWLALLDDPKHSVSDNFGAIMVALLRDLGGNQWRVREAAANALGDLLQGRRWEELQPYFEQLWTMTFRVVDDIKETVRLAGINLAKTVRGITLRLADPELTPPSQGREAISAALPLLLEKGLPSQVPEVRALSLDTSAKLVKAAGAELVRPHMPLLVPAMLESLSGLEDTRLNYIEQHAERLGLDQGRLESARVSAAQSGPVGETLDYCARYIDAATLAELAPRLAALVRRGVGLNTRAGAGRFISQVARRLGKDVQPAAPQLMKALVEACRADRSAAVRRSFAAANAAVARYAAPTRVERQVAAWLELYSQEDADRNDRLVAGLLLRELGKEAGDLFAQHAASVAPLAYLAQCDADADVASMWQDVWEESAASAGAGLRLHVREIVQLITAGLQSGQWGRKKAAAAALQRACKAAPDVLQPLAQQLMEALLKELPGRLWEGKECLLLAVGALAAACPLQLLGGDHCGSSSDGGGLAGRTVAALVEAAGKKKAAYRRAALEQMEAALDALGKAGSDQLEAAAPLLLELCANWVESQAGPRKMGTDGGEGEGAASAGGPSGSASDAATSNAAEGQPAAGSVPIAQVVACLAAAWCTAGADAAAGRRSAVSGTLADVLSAAGKAGDQLAAAAAATRFAEHCAALGGAGAGAPLLAADAAGALRLLRLALRLAGEGKAAQLREQCLALARALLLGVTSTAQQDQQGGSGHSAAGGLWGALGQGEREEVLGELRSVAEREKLPALQALAGGILAQLAAGS